MTVNRFNLRAYVKKYNKIYKVCELHTDNEYLTVQIIDNNNTVIFDKDKKINPTLFSKNEIELMQSTGLVDRNEKEIFEGDIIEFSTFRVVVKWEDCRFKIKSSCCNLALDIIRAEKCEVLGNIYENKELLGE